MNSKVVITESAPFAEIPEITADVVAQKGYWIRIMSDDRMNPPMFAIVAIPVSDSCDLVWLSMLRPTQAEALRDMQEGFEVSLSGNDRLAQVIRELISQGAAILLR